MDDLGKLILFVLIDMSAACYIVDLNEYYSNLKDMLGPIWNNIFR